jgi:hypothetical protein
VVFDLSRFFSKLQYSLCIRAVAKSARRGKANEKEHPISIFKASVNGP